MSGWIEKRANGRYRAKYRHLDGTQTSSTFALKADAQDWIAEQRTDVNRGDYVDLRHGDALYRDWAADVFRRRVGLEATTVARDDSYHANHVEPVWGDVPIGDITQLEVSEWVAAFTASGYSAAVVRRSYQLFSRVMRQAVAGGLIRSSPCIDIDLPPDRAVKPIRYLTPKQVDLLARSIDKRYRLMIPVMGFGGLRIGECAALRVKRLTGTRLEVSENIVEPKGHLIVKVPKTRAGVRTTLLPRSVAAELAELIDGRDPDAFVFESPQGGPLRPAQWRTRQFAPAVAKAKLSPLTPHDLRHSAVAIWIKAGWTPKEIAVRAGHASVATVLDRYGHLFPEDESQSVDRLDAVTDA